MKWLLHYAMTNSGVEFLPHEHRKFGKDGKDQVKPIYYLWHHCWLLGSVPIDGEDSD